MTALQVSWFENCILWLNNRTLEKTRVQEAKQSKSGNLHEIFLEYGILIPAGFGADVKLYFLGNL